MFSTKQSPIGFGLSMPVFESDCQLRGRNLVDCA